MFAGQLSTQNWACSKGISMVEPQIVHLRNATLWDEFCSSTWWCAEDGSVRGVLREPGENEENGGCYEGYNLWLNFAQCSRN